jgi:hypothetical protein
MTTATMISTARAPASATRRRARGVATTTATRRAVATAAANDDGSEELGSSARAVRGRERTGEWDVGADESND